MKWTTGIPGKEDTDWAGGVYTVTLEFEDSYPSKVREGTGGGGEREREDPGFTSVRTSPAL